MDEAPNECCRQPENLSEPQATDRPDLTFRRCQVCQCRHFLAIVEPAEVAADGAPL